MAELSRPQTGIRRRFKPMDADEGRRNAGFHAGLSHAQGPLLSVQGGLTFVRICIDIIFAYETDG